MIRVFYLIPLYNSEKTIINTLLSIYSKKHHIEVIIINDKSIDESLNRIKDIQGELLYELHIINNETNLGISRSLNKGIDLAIKKKADYLIRIDSDDFNLQNRTDYQIDYMESNSHVILCTSNARCLNSNSQTFGRIVNLKSFFENRFRPFSNMLGSIDIHPTFCIRIAPFLDKGIRYGTLPVLNFQDKNFSFMRDGMEDLLLVSILIYYYGFNSIFRDSRKKLISYTVGNKVSLTPSTNQQINHLLNKILIANKILYLGKNHNTKSSNIFRLSLEISKHQFKGSFFKIFIHSIVGYLIIKLKNLNLVYKLLLAPLMLPIIPRLFLQNIKR